MSQRVHAFARLAFVGKDDFVHRRRVEGFHIAGQTMRNVTRIETRRSVASRQTS